MTSPVTPIKDSRLSNEDQLALSSIEEIIDDARNGKPVILVDDEDRENEGDLIIPAQMATPEAINFMAREGRGLICLPLERAMVDRLGLGLMGRGDNTHHRTAFTVSIEAKEGVTTGISAEDRAHTIQTAINPDTKAHEIATPGHVFPLIARDGGVLERTGHTEAAVDISRLAGFSGAGVICEIMNEDGTMSRLPQLIAFAQKHNLKVGTIADLVAFRMRRDKLVERVTESTLNHKGQEFRLIVFTNKLDGIEHITLVKGDVTPNTPTTVRMHALNVMTDVLGAGGSLPVHDALDRLSQEERGVFVLLREHDSKAPSKLLAKLKGIDDPTPPNPENALRRYGIGAQILKDLGVQDMVLLTSSKKTIIGLNGFGLNILAQRDLNDG